MLGSLLELATRFTLGSLQDSAQALGEELGEAFDIDIDI